MTGKAQRVFTGVLASLLVAGMGVSSAYSQDYGSRLGQRRGGAVTFEPRGSGVMYDALDPAVKRWYIPQELYQEYKWKSWEYSNYARKPYQRYVDVANQGDYFYDVYGNFVTKGWLIYDWRQETNTAQGNSIFQDPRYASWFSRLVVAADSKGSVHYSVTVGDQIRTTLTPMTFSKPKFNGIQIDAVSDKYAGTLLVSRVSSPISGGRRPGHRTGWRFRHGGRNLHQCSQFAYFTGGIQQQLPQGHARRGTGKLTGEGNRPHPQR